MAILAFILLLISITKLLLVVSCKNTLQVKKLSDGSSLNVDVYPNTFPALLTADGLVGLFCSIYLLTVVL